MDINVSMPNGGNCGNVGNGGNGNGNQESMERIFQNCTFSNCNFYSH